MKDLKTVEDLNDIKIQDPLSNFQREGVARMRTSLLSCTMDSTGNTAKQALQQITVMRIYHQISRVIKYLDLMDKLEDKLYSSIEQSIDNMAEANPSTWAMLLRIQSQLQDNMLQSQKLLAPYMNINSFSLPEIVENSKQADSTAYLIPQESREKLRTSAQAILVELEAGDEIDEDSES